MDNDTQREHLLLLTRKILDSRDRGGDDVDSLAEFERLLPGTDIGNLCHSDWPAEMIVDVCLGYKDAERELSREELLTLVRQIMDPGSVSEAENNLAVRTFEFNCKHPAKGDLIFYPDDYFDGQSDPTAEEIVEKAMRGE